MNLSGIVMSRDAREGAECSIERDREAGIFDQIHHIWVKAGCASSLGFDSPGSGSRQLKVKHFFDILISNSGELDGNGICGLMSIGTPYPINLLSVKKQGDLLDTDAMVENLVNSVAKMKTNEINKKDFRLWFNPVVAFVVAAYIKKPITDILKELMTKGDVLLRDVPFFINHTFEIEVSSKRPRSISPQAKYYTHATVDKDGWIVGQSKASKALATA